MLGFMSKKMCVCPSSTADLANPLKICLNSSGATIPSISSGVITNKGAIHRRFKKDLNDSSAPETFLYGDKSDKSMIFRSYFAIYGLIL